MRIEVRFYVCILLGFILLMCGFFAPPPGEISNSVLIGAGTLFGIGGLVVGIDLKGIIHELTVLKKYEYNLLELKGADSKQQSA